MIATLGFCVYTEDEVGVVEFDMSPPSGRCAARYIRSQGLLWPYLNAVSNIKHHKIVILSTYLTEQRQRS
jgi:hypothetical protein